MKFTAQTLKSVDDLHALGLEIQTNASGYQTQLDYYLKERHLSAADLAKLTGISRQNVSAILNCRIAPSIVMALKFAAILGCKVEDLFELTEDAWMTKAREDERALYFDHLTLQIVTSFQKNKLRTLEDMWIHLEDKTQRRRSELSLIEMQSGDWRPRFEPLMTRLTPMVARAQG